MDTESQEMEPNQRQKREAINKLEEPKSIQELELFLGMVAYVA